MPNYLEQLKAQRAACLEHYDWLIAEEELKISAAKSAPEITEEEDPDQEIGIAV